MPAVEIIFKYTKKEYIEALRTYYRKRLRIGLDLILGMLAIFGGMILSHIFGPEFPFTLLIITGTMLLATPLMGLYVLPTMRFRRNDKIHDEYFLSFSDENIHFKTARIDSKIEWKIYSEVWEADDFFYLLNTKDNITIVPKRAFRSDSDLTQFRNLLESKISSKFIMIQ